MSQAFILLIFHFLLVPVFGAEKFLYDTLDSTVREIKSRRHASTPQKSEIRIYYASWCYHCISFAPSYKKIANSVIADGYDVAFTALSCVEYGDACTSMKIPGYPAIKAYNFASDPASLDTLGVTIGKSSEGIKKYVKDNAIKRVSSGKVDRNTYQAELDALINETSQLHNVDVKEWIKHTTRSQATDTLATKRLADALKAFEFLLSTEGVTNISEEKKNALARMLLLIITLLPDVGGNSGEQRHKYQLLLDTVNKESMEYLSAHWSQLKPVDETEEILWSLCGENGYTCGLWQLLHFLTIAGGELSLHHDEYPMSPARTYSATNIKDHIRDIVKYFFSCNECRDHFLKSFNECEFYHCKNDDNDFNSLQIWLWKLHNSITSRILREKLGNSDVSSDTIIKTNEKILWPSNVDCRKCRKQVEEVDIKDVNKGKFPFFDEKQVVLYVKEAYWDSSWLLPGQSAHSLGSFGSYLTSPDTSSTLDSSTLFISFAVALSVMGIIFSRQLLLSRSNRTPMKNTKTPLLLRASDNMIGSVGLNYHRVWSDDERGSCDDNSFMNNSSSGSQVLNNSNNRSSDARQRSTGSVGVSGSNSNLSSSLSHIGRFGSFDEGTPRPSIRI